MVNQLARGSASRVSILALGGYASQSYCDQIRRDVGRQNRPAILLIAVDHDPSGEDILRDFIARTDCWAEVHRIALTPDQVTEYRLPEYVPTPAELAKLENDPRAEVFRRRHGSLVQYELDALAPEDLRNLYRSAIEEFWDADAYDAVMEREDAERAQLSAVADEYGALSGQ